MSLPARPGPDLGAVWPAPAKLNLMLRILGRRADGFHELQTVFQFLDYGDELRFLPRDDGRITRPRGLPGLPAEQDLAVRAAALLRRETGAGGGVEIHVTKRIPDGGGLGGGGLSGRILDGRFLGGRFLCGHGSRLHDLDGRDLDRVWIRPEGLCFIEVDSVLCAVGQALLGVEFKLHVYT